MSILGLRALSNVAILSDFLITSINSVILTQLSINVLSLLGINHDDSQAIEIFVYLIIAIFITDHLAYAKVYSPAFYTEKFK